MNSFVLVLSTGSTLHCKQAVLSGFSFILTSTLAKIKQKYSLFETRSCSSSGASKLHGSSSSIDQPITRTRNDVMHFHDQSTTHIVFSPINTITQDIESAKLNKMTKKIFSRLYTLAFFPRFWSFLIFCQLRIGLGQWAGKALAPGLCAIKCLLPTMKPIFPLAIFRIKTRSIEV